MELGRCDGDLPGERKMPSGRATREDGVPPEMNRPSIPVVSPLYESVLEDLRERPRTWLITGVAGFIGSNLLEQLLALGQRVVGVDNFSTGYQSNLDEVLALHVERAVSFRMIRGDIRDLEVCRAACEGVELVLHEAALGAAPRSLHDPTMTNAVNVTGFLNLLLAARDAGVRRVVYASSGSVYGDTGHEPRVEERIGRPTSPYAVTKCADELYGEVFQRAFGLEVIGLRYFNVFGRRQDANGEYAGVIQEWTRNLLENAPCRMAGDGESSSDYCYVANAVQANLLAATGPSDATNEVYNVALGKTTTLNELFRMIRLGLAGYRSTIAADPVRGGVAIDARHTAAVSIEKARHRLGYEPTHSVSAGLSEALAWYVNGGGAIAHRAARQSADAGPFVLEAVG